MAKINYMDDDFRAFGTDSKELYRIADLIDKSTETRLCNFSESEILHYTGHDSLNLYFVVFGTINPIKIMIQKEGIAAALPKNRSMSISKFLRTEKVPEIVKDFIKGKNLTVFNLPSSFPEENGVLFTSEVSRKTLLPRLSSKLTIREEYLERDALLAKLIGENPEILERYVVFRKSGSIKKMFGVFTGDPNRIPFRDAVIAASSYSPDAKCKFWEITNRFGVRACYYYPKIEEELKSSFPRNRYKPIVAILTCDSGHETNRVAFGWARKGNTEFNPFYTHEIVIENDGDNIDIVEKYQKAITDGIDYLREDAQKMFEMSKSKVNCSDQEYADILTKIANCCITSVNAGIRAKNSFMRYAENVPKATTELDLVDLVLVASETGTFRKISEYADIMIRKKGIRALIA